MIACNFINIRLNYYILPCINVSDQKIIFKIEKKISNSFFVMYKQLKLVFETVLDLKDVVFNKTAFWKLKFKNCNLILNKTKLIVWCLRGRGQTMSILGVRILRSAFVIEPQL